MLSVGLTGGIASGKSTVGKLLASYGAILIDSDVLAREVVEPGTSGLSEIVAAFGPDVLAADGSLDRAKLGAVVFNDSAARRRLESIIHPRVRARASEIQAAAPEGAVVVQDIPLLVETGQASRFDAVVVVDAPEEVQLARLAERGLSASDAKARIAAQATREQRRAVADHVIDNSGDLESLERQVRAVWERLTGG
ncbi:dephospho-CoA kinase [Flindersiella endophytica]